MTISWTASAGTDVGRVREGNEDAFRLDEERGIFLVADGMGGHAAGEVASRLAADEVLRVLVEAGDSVDGELFKRAFANAHREICDCCENDPGTAGMGTTVTAAWISPDGHLIAGHIGDSRLYRYDGEQLELLTRDHTWVQREVDEGRVDPSRAHAHPLSHILTRVLSDTEPSEPDVVTAVLRPGDRLLFCTDGLHNMLDDDEILDCLQDADSTGDAIDLLIDGANDSGGVDNITAIVVELAEA